MTRKEALATKPGDIVYDKKFGFPFEVVRVCPWWIGFLTYQETQTTPPNGYNITLKPVEGQDNQGEYKFEPHYTFGRGISIDIKKLKKK